MRVLVFVEKFMSLTLTFVYNEVTELAKYHNVKIVCNDRINEDKFPFNNLEVIPFKVGLLKEKVSWYAEKLDLSVYRKSRLFKRDLLKIIREYEPDIIHGHFGYESIKLVDNIKITEIPIFISFHGYDASQMLKKKSYVRKLNCYFKHNNIIPIYVSEFIKRNLINEKVIIKKAELLYCGIDTDFFDPINRKERKNETFIFLQISVFNEKKGHIYTLKAFKLFLERVTNDRSKYKLILAGGHILLEEIKKEVVLLGLSSNVEFTGPVDHTIGKKLLEDANVFVHHSITASNGDTEGLPNALMEAMSMELPVLSTRHAGIPELVEDSVNGYLVNEKDIESYAKRMVDVLTWGYLKRNREKIISNFSKKAHCESLIGIYKKYSNKV